MKFRTDVMYSLVAFESVLIAIAAILWFPTWVLAVAIAAFVFSTIEMVGAIARARKFSYDEKTGNKPYKFPVGQFILYAIILTFATAIAILAIKKLFGYMLVALAFLLVGLLILAIIGKLKMMKLVCSLLLAVLVIFLVCYGTAKLVHSGVSLNPGLAQTEQLPNDTETPNDEAQTPSDDTQAPVEDTETPGDDTQAPVEDPETPGDDTQAPVEDPETPDDEQNTTGNIKVTCPETMKYGVPVTITVEGIDVDNLVYGNEDFLSIVKVSDTQVVLTLVGIVNDFGQVEIVPASGYITVTDSVSGTNFSISIVE